MIELHAQIPASQAQTALATPAPLTPKAAKAIEAAKSIKLESKGMRATAQMKVKKTTSLISVPLLILSTAMRGADAQKVTDRSEAVEEIEAKTR